jgi:hypothetical protein
MGSVPGHPLWAHVIDAMKEQVAAGRRDPLGTTGPHLLTPVVRVRMRSRLTATAKVTVGDLSHPWHDTHNSAVALHQ